MSDEGHYWWACTGCGLGWQEDTEDAARASGDAHAPMHGFQYRYVVEKSNKGKPGWVLDRPKEHAIRAYKRRIRKEVEKGLAKKIRSTFTKK